MLIYSACQYRNTCVVSTSTESFLPSLDFLFEIGIQPKENYWDQQFAPITRNMPTSGRNRNVCWKGKDITQTYLTK